MPSSLTYSVYVDEAGLQASGKVQRVFHSHHFDFSVGGLECLNDTV